jgi:HSP20 family molecular chaperone IbpA
MWAQAFDLLEQADRLHRHFFQLSREPEKGPCWEPPVDLFESEQRLVIVVALPGVPVEQLQIVIDGAALSVIGERPPAVFGSAMIRRLEIPYGRFERRIDLPRGRFEIEERVLEYGCLRLILRKL